jgi:hypothetical protein
MNLGAGSCVGLPEEKQAGSLLIRELGRLASRLLLDPGASVPRLFYMPFPDQQHVVFQCSNYLIAMMMPIDRRIRVNLSLRENISCFMYFRRVNHTANTSSHVTIKYDVLPKEIHQQECVDGRPQ